jgi:phosphatidyl-myo-inositol alpha-mannosyltransferase
MARVPAVLARRQGRHEGGARVRVALVCPYSWDRVGGVQSHVRGLARALRARDHEVAVFAPHSTKEGSHAEEGVTIVGRAVGVPANGSVAPLAFGPLAAAGVRRALASFEPEVCHLHEPLIPSLSLLALWAARVPCVGTFHASSEGSFGYRVGRVVLERAARRLAVRTAVSDAARALVARYFPGEYALTPNGVEVAAFRPSGDVARVPTVLFLSRIERRKGLEVLIQAMARIRDVDARLVVAGDGPEARAGRLLADRLSVDAEWRGVVSDQEKVALFQSAGVYCAPGLGGESFGIVLVEAMAAGAPVVCSDLPGFKAVAGGAARLVPRGDAGALADALRGVLTDPTEAAAMSKQSLRMSGLFDWGRIASGVETVYERAAGARIGR